MQFRKTWKNYPEFTFREQSIHSFFTHAFVLKKVFTTGCILRSAAVSPLRQVPQAPSLQQTEQRAEAPAILQSLSYKDNFPIQKV